MNSLDNFIMGGSSSVQNLLPLPTEEAEMDFSSDLLDENLNPGIPVRQSNKSSQHKKSTYKNDFIQTYMPKYASTTTQISLIL